jgi:hypothetical protein
VVVVQPCAGHLALDIGLVVAPFAEPPIHRGIVIRGGNESRPRRPQEPANAFHAAIVLPLPRVQQRGAGPPPDNLATP